MTLRLCLTSWLNHADLDLETRQPVTIIAGPNASGKSAILHGLEFNLLGTGKLRGIKTKQDLAFLSIHDDARSTGVWLEIPQIPLVISRTMDRNAGQSVMVGPTTYDVSKGDAKIRTVLGLEPEQLRAALEADHLLLGDEAKRQRVLIAAAGAEGGREEVATALEETGLAGEDIGRLMEQAIGDSFLDAQKTAETERAAQTRRLREDAIEAPEPRFHPPWSSREIRLDQVTMETLRQREASLQSMLGTSEREAGASRARLEVDLENAKRLQETLVCEGEQLAERQEILESADALLAEARTVYDALDTESKELQAELVKHRDEAQRIASGEVEKPELCPAIPGGPRCPMSKAKLDAHRKQLEGRADELAELITADSDHLPELLAGLERGRQGLQIAQDDADELAAGKKRGPKLHEELDAAEDAVAKALMALNAAPEKEQDESSSPEFVRGRLENLRRLITQKTRFETNVAAAASDAQHRRQAEEQRAAWDRAAKLLAPDGIPSRLFASRASNLQAYIDEFGIAPIRLTPAVELEAKIDARWRRRAQLSESWQLRLSMAASHMLARAALFPVLILDRFDHLDPEGRIAVLGGARCVAKHYPGGVLIFATGQHKKPEPTGLEDVEMLWLHDGGLERIG